MNFFIFHGVYANPEANWFPWMKKELEKKGYEVLVPKFPTPLDQSLESWMRSIAKYEDRINKDTVLIGHSLGAAFILDYLEKASKKIYAAFLIAPFHKQLGSSYDELNKTFIDKQFDWEKIKSSCSKFFIFASDNDRYIPFDITKELIKKLNAKFHLVANGGHLNKESGCDKLPILLETIKAELGV